MIEFAELIIKNGILFIDVSVIDSHYYENVYIDKIIIDNQDTFRQGGPSSTPVYTYSLSDDSHNKRLSLRLDGSDILDNIQSSILFVYVVTKGAPALDTPCGMDNTVTLGVAYDEMPILKDLMSYIKEVSNTCTVPKGFIDYYMRLKAVKLALEVGNYNEAIKYWNRFFSGRKPVVHSNKCGCHGIS